ncbi:hypothetical protein Tco_0098215 [Tanacetum coccineum]
MIALIAKRRRDFATQRFQDKRNKPMTYAQQKAYMRTFVMYQSSTIYTTGWTMKHVKSFSDDQPKTEFDKIRTAVTELKSQNIRGGLLKDLVQIWSKLVQRRKSKSTEAPKSDVPADSQQPSVEVPSQKATIEDVEVPSNTASTAQHTGSSPKKYASDVDSASDDDTPINFFAVVDWELLSMGLGLINVFYKKDNYRKCFTNKKAAGVGLVLWGDLKVLMDSPEVNDGSDVWKNQHTWSIQSWKLYSYSGVHVLGDCWWTREHMFGSIRSILSLSILSRTGSVHQARNQFTTQWVSGLVSIESPLKLTDVSQYQCWVEIVCNPPSGIKPFLGYPKLDGFHLPYSWNEKWLVQEGTALGNGTYKSHSSSCGGLVASMLSCCILLHVVIKVYEVALEWRQFQDVVVQNPLGWCLRSIRSI